MTERAFRLIIILLSAELRPSGVSADRQSSCQERMDQRSKPDAAQNGSVRRATSAQKAVLRGIGLAIMSGEFPGGAALPAKEVLMHRFGVSNTPLREALQSLASKGVVAAKTKVGTWVRPEAEWNMFDPDLLAWRLEIGIDQTFLAKLFEMRQTLEPVAAALAATRRTEADVGALRRLVGEMAEVKSDKAEFTRADVAIHVLVLAMSGNPFMQSIGAMIETALAASFSFSAPTDDPERACAAIDQHAAIVEAIARREPQTAFDAMMNVIHQGWMNIGGSHEPLARAIVERYVVPVGSRRAPINPLGRKVGAPTERLGV